MLDAGYWIIFNRERYMAVRWEVKIKPINIEKETVSVIANLIDDTEPDNVKIIKSFSILNAVIKTAEQRVAIMEHIWNMYQSSLAEDFRVAEFLGNLETQAEDCLNGRM